MKKLLLIFTVVLTCKIASSQSCANINPGSAITKIANGLFKLNVNFSGSGQKHLNIQFFEGPVLPANLISTICIPIFNSGTDEVNFVSPGNNPRAVITPGSGNCGGGGDCPLNAVTITYIAPFVLPVVLKSFDVYYSDQKALIRWVTASEQNVKEFSVQSNTGNGYIDVKSIPPTNQPNGSIYTFNDLINFRTIQYRLKIIDADGAFSYSPVRVLKTDDSGNSLYPNPVKASQSVSISNVSQSDKISLLDNAGRELLNTNGVSVINTALLKPGSYMVRIAKMDGSLVMKKLLIIK